MNDPWGPHDIGGQSAGPVDLSEHDIAHWEWQVDAMVRLALQKGLISDFAELRDGIEQLSPDDYDRFDLLRALGQVARLHDSFQGLDQRTGAE